MRQISQNFFKVDYFYSSASLISYLILYFFIYFILLSMPLIPHNSLWIPHDSITITSIQYELNRWFSIIIIDSTSVEQLENLLLSVNPGSTLGYYFSHAQLRLRDFSGLSNYFLYNVTYPRRLRSGITIPPLPQQSE